MITVQVQGEIGTLRVSDGIEAQGYGSDALQVEGGAVGLQDLVFELSSWMLCCIQEAEQERSLLLTLALKGNDLGYTMYPSRPNTTSYTQCQWL